MAAADPRLAEAVKLHQSGRVAEAIARYRQVLQADAGAFDAIHMLGVALCQSRAPEEGLALLRRAHALRPQSLPARLSLAQALVQTRAYGEALPLFAVAAREAHGDGRALFGEVHCLVHLQRAEEALALLAAAAARQPLTAELLNERGKAEAQLGRYEAAAADHGRALQLAPDNLEAAFNLGRAQAELGELAAAEKTLRKVIAKAPQHGPAKLALASVCRQSSRSEEAAALAQSVIERAPRSGAAKVMLAMALLDSGKSQEAENLFRAAIASRTALADALEGLAQLHSFTAADPEPALVRDLLAGSALSARDRQSLLYTLAKMEDDLGRPGEAVAAATAAKAVLPVPQAFEAYAAFARGVAARMDAAFFAQHRGKGLETQQPVFIIGMPRSGTSLVEQIIAAHPEAEGAGELQAMPQLAGELAAGAATAQALVQKIAALDGPATAAAARRYLIALQAGRRPGAARITDKLPHNFQNLWLIALLFPQARIVHCRRHPVDVAISIYLRHFGRGHWYAQSLQELGRFHKLYEELTAHWRRVTGLAWHEVTYESLVSDPQPAIRDLIGFTGLAWHDACLDPAGVVRTVSTFSATQVRRPIYTTSVARWRKYAPFIRPLLDELGIAP